MVSPSFPGFDGGTYMKRGGEDGKKKSGKRVELWIRGRSVRTLLIGSARMASDEGPISFSLFASEHLHYASPATTQGDGRRH